MRILVIHLLRLGDVLMAAPALLSLRRKYPSAEIHLLVNEGLPDLSGLMPFIDVWHRFPRNQLQSLARERNKRLLEPLEEVLKFTDSLNSLRFHMAFNITQNRLSARLFSLIDCAEKTGMMIDEHDRCSFGSPWLRHLNDDKAINRKRNFHYCDIFSGVFEIEDSAVNFRFASSRKNDGVLEGLVRDLKKNVIALQPLTSDSKKNWSWDKWSQLVRELTAQFEDCTIFVLGAEFERTVLEDFYLKVATPLVDVRLALVDLSEAHTLLNRSNLLITGDTAMKHLAAGANCKIVEISIGSSEPLRTGPYKDGSIVLSSKAPCRPCPHSQNCSQEHHLCDSHVSVNAVVEAALLQMNGLGRRSCIEAGLELDHVELLRVHLKPGLPWIAGGLNESESDLVDDLIEKVSWRLHLEGNGGGVPPVASQGRRLLQILRSGGRLLDELSRLEKLEGSLRNQYDKLFFLRGQMPRIAAVGNGATVRWAQLIEEMRVSGIFRSPTEADSMDLSMWRRVQLEIESASAVCENRIKLIRTIRDQEIGEMR